MTKDIALYIEGGGDTAQTLEPFRRGMSAFLAPIVKEARKKRIRWRVIPCGGRKAAYDAFVDAVEKEPDVFNVLLVDSEEPIAITVPSWKHLKDRPGDGWEKPQGVGDEHCQMMVACMEAWFLADPQALRRHFGGNFNDNGLPAPRDAETRTKAAIAQALKNGTRPTPAREYGKIRDGAKLLALIQPPEVRRHCKWCERLFKTLGDAIGVAL